MIKVEEAKLAISKLHPLQNTPYEKVFPTIGCCFKCCFCCCADRTERSKEELKKII
jgi:hypothetical protein